jgi:hypothetical protein
MGKTVVDRYFPWARVYIIKQSDKSDQVQNAEQTDIRVTKECTGFYQQDMQCVINKARLGQSKLPQGESGR